MAEKTEKATPKKLRDARKKGQVAKSQDFPSAFTFVASLALVVTMSGYLFDILGSFLVKCFKMSSSKGNLDYQVGSIVYDAIMVIFNSSIPILILVSLLGVLINFLIVGPLFAPEAMKFDLKKLNPVTNLKNIFKFKTVFELLKSLFKIAGAIFLIYTVMIDSIPEIIATAAMPVLGIAEVFSSFLIKVVVRVGIFFLVVAIIDLIYQKRNFAKEMKMEKFEVKQEYKDTEGDPHIKGKRKQVAQEIAYQEGPSGVHRAKAVITNPTHIAVAIDYREDVEPAPKIVTMGKDFMAEQIIKAAEKYNIPIMRNVALAQTLYEKGTISDYIPEETFQAVAEILKWLSRMEAGSEEILDIFKQGPGSS